MQEIQEKPQVQSNQPLYFSGLEKHENYDSVLQFMERLGPVEWLDLEMDSHRKRYC